METCSIRAFGRSGRAGSLLSCPIPNRRSRLFHWAKSEKWSCQNGTFEVSNDVPIQWIRVGSSNTWGFECYWISRSDETLGCVCVHPNTENPHRVYKLNRNLMEWHAKMDIPNFTFECTIRLIWLIEMTFCWESNKKTMDFGTSWASKWRDGMWLPLGTLGLI